VCCLQGHWALVGLTEKGVVEVGQALREAKTVQRNLGLVSVTEEAVCELYLLSCRCGSPWKRFANWSLGWVESRGRGCRNDRVGNR